MDASIITTVATGIGILTERDIDGVVPAAPRSARRHLVGS